MLHRDQFRVLTGTQTPADAGVSEAMHTDAGQAELVGDLAKIAAVTRVGQ